MEGAVAAMRSKTAGERRKFIKEGMSMRVSSGLTAIQTNDEGSFAVYKELAREEGLPLRIFLTPTIEEIQDKEKKEESMHLLPFQGPEHDLGDRPPGRHTSRLVAERVKIF